MTFTYLCWWILWCFSSIFTLFLLTILLFLLFCLTASQLLLLKCAVLFFLICGTLGCTSQSDDGTFPPLAFRKEWYLTCDGQMSQRSGLDQTHNFLSEEVVQGNFLPNGFLLSEFFPLRLSTIVGSEEWKRAKGFSSKLSDDIRDGQHGKQNPHESATQVRL